MRGLTYFLSASLFALTFFYLFQNRKTVCITSQFVSAVAYVQKNEIQSIYNCKKSKAGEFSPFLMHNLNEIQTRVSSLETLLNSLRPFRNKIQISIFADRPYYFSVQHNSIEIGEALLFAEGHLEKALARLWYRENAKGWFLTNNIFEEVIGDFLIFANSGKFEIVDPIHKFRTKVGGAKWPQVIKSVQGYCESSWRLPDHFEHCLNVAKRSDLNASEIIQLSLRPLVTSSWIKSYKNLGFKQRSQFLKSLPQILSLDSLSSEQLLSQLLNEKQPVQQALLTIRNFHTLMTSDEKVMSQDMYRLFTSQFANDLRASGVNDAFAEAFFDFVFRAENESINPQSKTFKNMQALAIKNPNLQIAIYDKDNLWMLPSEYPIQVKAFGHIRTNKMAIVRCGSYDFDYVLSFSEQTERLLVIDKCNMQTALDFSEFFQKGVTAFSQKNSSVSFINFHLPSLALRKTQLATIKDVYTTIESRDSDNPVVSTLGWNELMWDQSANAYRPHAVIDGIDLFRMEKDRTTN